MDSPEVTKTTIASAATVTSPIVQESPFSNYLSNLSPIEPVKSSRLSQGYADLSSPPLVFTSPHMVPQREASLLRRLQCPQTSSSPTAKVVGKEFADIPPDLEKCDSYFSRRFIIGSQKDNDHISCTKELRDSPSGCVDKYLSEAVDAECADCLDSTSLIREPSADPLESSERGSVNLEENKLESRTDKEVLNFETEPTDTGHDRSTCVPPSDDCNKSNSQLQLDLVSNEVQSGNCSIKDLQENEVYHEHVAGGFENPECDVIQINPEGSQLHRGMSRRCLQFEEARGIGKGSVLAMNSPSSSSNVMGSGLPFSAGMESSKLSDSGFAVPTRKTQMINLSRVLTSIRPPNNNAKTILTISKPSGIGLHLNSILNASPMGCTASESIKSQSVDNEGSSAKLSTSVDKFHGTAEDRTIENQAAPVSVSSTTDSFQTTKSLITIQSFDPNTTPQEKRSLESEQNESSPKKKRKTHTRDGDGCKRCNCKKTKCLKLYCDCFAAGNYCSDSCSCQGCFNRPEYKDTVLETRQLIESRNPLAFAPKVVHHASRVPAVVGADVNGTTPSSARHKRGCNCKKSMCLKKYCECYQANVGCSSGCRCEGCKNVYGMKDEYATAEEFMSSTTSKDPVEDTAADKLQMVVYSDDRMHAELYNAQSPAPFTPQLQFSEHGDGAPKSRPFSTRYLQSPLSDISTFQSGAKSSSSPKESNDKLAEKSGDVLSVGSCGQEMEYSIAEMMDQFSPSFDPIGDVCDRNASSSSASTTKELASVSRPQLLPGGGGRVCSLRWRGSPITPMPNLGEISKSIKELDSGQKMSEVLMGDDTPEILKETCSPVQSVKATSPNKKRVSPPHTHAKTIRGFGSLSSGSLRSGRKFVLKSVPSFPPLTPCLGSKANNNKEQEK